MKSFKLRTKIMSLLLIVGLVLPFVGCGQQKAASTEVKASPKVLPKVSIEFCGS